MGGDFATASNWQDQSGNPGVPGVNDDALILNPAVVVTSTSANTVHNLTSTALIDVSAGVLTVTNANLTAPLNISGGTVTVGGTLNAAVVSETGGTLNGTGHVDLATGMAWTGGTIAAAVNVASGATLNINGAALKALDNATITNAGTAIWNGTGGIEFRHNAAVQNDGVLNDVADHAATFVGTGTEVATLHNAGQLNKTAGAGITDIGVVLDNTGTVQAKSGTLRFSTNVKQVQVGALEAGAWCVGAGATLDFTTSTFTFTSSSVSITLDGAGAAFTPLTNLDFNSGNLTLTHGANLTTTSSFFNSNHLTIGPGSKLSSTSLTLDSSSRTTLQIGGRPVSGQYGRIVLTGSMSLDGALAVDLVPGADTLNGDVYSFITGTGRSGTPASITQSGAGTVSPFNVTVGATTVTATANTDLTDLAVTGVTAPVAAAAPGDPVSISWTVKNNATVATAVTSWTDSIYVSTSPTFDASAVFVSQVPHSGALAQGASYIGNYLGPLPGVPAGSYYVFVRADAGLTVPDAYRTNNVGASSLTFTVNPPTALTLGASTPSTVAAGQDAWYQIAAPGGTGLEVTTTFTAAGAGELYVGYKQFPQSDTAIGAATDAASATEQVVLPTTQAGIYYVRVHGITGGSFTIQADTLTFAITGLVNTTGGNTGSATLTVHGVGFTPLTTVSLATGAGTVRAASKVYYVDSGTVYATFDLKGVSTGSYDVKVTDGTRTATSAGGYTVTNATAGRLSYQIIQPATVQSGRTTYAYIEFTNNGGTDIPAPLLMMEPAGFSGVVALVGEPPSENGFGAGWTYFLPTSTDAPAGLIPPGYHGRIQVAISSTSSPGATIGIDLKAVNTGRKIPWSEFSYMVQLPDQGFHSPAENAIFANFVATVGNTSDTFAAALGDAATYLAIAGTPVRDAGALMAYLLRQADTSLPSRSLGEVTDATAPTQGLGLDFTREFLTSVQGRYRSGRLGRGWVDKWDIYVTGDGSDTEAHVYTAGVLEEFTSPTFGGGAFYSFNGEDVLEFDGTRFVLTAHDGTVTAFRADGQLDYLQDPGGTRVTAGYDTLNHLASLTHSGGRALAFTTNKAGLITSVTATGGLITTYKYAGDHLASATGQEGTTKYTYKGGPSGSKYAVTSVTAPSGVKSVLMYDKLGRLIKQTTGKTEAVVYSYGPGGGFTTTPTGGRSTTVISDFEGRIAAIRASDGSDLRFRFDTAGRAIRTEAATGQVWTQIRDEDGLVTALTDPLGRTVRNSYQDHLLTGYTDARGYTTAYRHDVLGNVLAITHPGGGVEQYVYDPLGGLVESVNRRGNAVQFVTDAVGNLIRRVHADGSHTDYTYDASGNQTSATDASGTTTLTYFPNLALQKITYPGGKSLEYTYDKGGRRATSKDQDGFTTTYVYDAADRLAELRDGAGASLVKYTYDAGGRLQRTTHANGTATDYTYDPFGRVITIFNSAPDASTNSEYEYTYDAAGNVDTMTVDNVRTTYGYDLTGQLISVATPGRTITYTYDAAGNRTSVTDNGVTSTYAFDNENKVTDVATPAGTTTYGYDDDGNRETMTVPGIGTTTYTWDDLNRLTGVSSPTDTFGYTYDLFDRLLTSTRNGQTTTNLNDPFGLGTVAAQYGSGGLIARYVYGLGLEARVDGAGGRAFYDVDQIGNVIGLTDSAGGYVNHYSYLPFGETTTLRSDLANPFTFVGAAGVSADGNGLFNMRARSYDPALGGFISDDPLGLTAGDTNFRRYAGNSPTNLIDPSGLKCSDDEKKKLKQQLDEITKKDFSLKKYNDLLTEATTYENTLKPGERNAAGKTRLEVTREKNNFREYWNQKYPATKKVDELRKQLEDCDKPKKVSLNFMDLAVASPGQPDVPGVNEPPETPVEPTEVGIPPLIVNPPAGPGGVIGNKKKLPFSIDVKNLTTGRSTHTLHVAQQLDSDLDYSTFELGSLDLGGLAVNIPAGRQSYETRVDARASLGVFVDVKAGLDRSTGLVSWDLKAIDPATLQVPVSADLGFLPAPAAPSGSLFYTVGTRADVADGAIVDASATITFDGGTPFVTPNVSNIVDAAGPVTTINALPAHSPASFNVTWSGTDPHGVAFYDVYVSIDGASFALWSSGTTATTVKYKAKGHHSYGFVVRAHDNVGNVTTMPGSAQATTST